jgi:hypothetical protein
VKAHSTAGKWRKRACSGHRRVADVAPIVIRYTEDGRSLLIGMAGDYQKNKGCGSNADFVVYFWIV